MIDENKVVIQPKHLREAGLCIRGAKQWFTLHGLDFDHFLRHGYRVEEVRPLNDALAEKMAQIAITEANEVQA